MSTTGLATSWKCGAWPGAEKSISPSQSPTTPPEEWLLPRHKAITVSTPECALSERLLPRHSPCCPPNATWIAAQGRDGCCLVYAQKPQGGWPSMPRVLPPGKGLIRPAPYLPLSMPLNSYPRQREAVAVGWARGRGCKQGPGGRKQIAKHSSQEGRTTHELRFEAPAHSP